MIGPCYVKVERGWAIGSLDDSYKFRWWTDDGWRHPGEAFDAEHDNEIITFRTIAAARKLSRTYGWEL